MVLDVSEEHYLRHQDLKVFRLKERILRSLAFRVVTQILNRYLITFPMYTCISFLHNLFQYRKQPITARVPVCRTEPHYLADRPPTRLDGRTLLWMNAVNGNRTGWTVLYGDVQICVGRR